MIYVYDDRPTLSELQREILISVDCQYPTVSELPPGQDCTAEGQCVEHAECSTPEGGVCTCDADFYKDVGKCSPLKPPGERCTGDQQCVTNAECSKTGQCQCSPGYYALDGVCAVSTATVWTRWTVWTGWTVDSERDWPGATKASFVRSVREIK